jgi:hypothetical protein
MNGAGSTSSDPFTLPAIGTCGSPFAIGEGVGSEEMSGRSSEVHITKSVALAGHVR